ncbi:hypothetical protein [Parvularcula maris]|uniref:Uncharacterized protein n=1 Tax=Parvularcula maris TaxID=2965077 RepID=A0A9X2L675_9PROT|nr:hypothetical protein [Parvularcula maris]MCQ8183818.1 hypothetical protein [Parvularcula maris]
MGTISGKDCRRSDAEVGGEGARVKPGTGGDTCIPLRLTTA